MAENLPYRQLSFIGPDVLIPSKEEVPIGGLAAEVVEKILQLYNVQEFSYTEYDPKSAYFLDKDQPHKWDVWSGLESIEKISREIFEESIFPFHFEGVVMMISKIFALASKVKIDGKTNHIPMLDFDLNEKDFKKLDLKSIGLPRGFILKTDNSYHFYGLDLLDNESWKCWIEKLMGLENSEGLFGRLYLSMCLERGYSALRIWNYPGTEKKTSPVVVSRI